MTQTTKEEREEWLYILSQPKGSYLADEYRDFMKRLFADAERCAELTDERAMAEEAGIPASGVGICPSEGNGPIMSMPPRTTKGMKERMLRNIRGRFDNQTIPVSVGTLRCLLADAERCAELEEERTRPWLVRFGAPEAGVLTINLSVDNGSIKWEADSVGGSSVRMVRDMEKRIAELEAEHARDVRIQHANTCFAVMTTQEAEEAKQRIAELEARLCRFTEEIARLRDEKDG